jgi:hypothetical protein
MTREEAIKKVEELQTKLELVPDGTEEAFEIIEQIEELGTLIDDVELEDEDEEFIEDDDYEEDEEYIEEGALDDED